MQVITHTLIDPLGRPGPDALVPINLADRYDGDPHYVHGAIELEIGGIMLLDRSMWDLVDQLWIYWIMAIEQATFAPGAEFYFPDQPIRVVVDSKRDPWEIRVNYHDTKAGSEVLRSVRVPPHHFLPQLLPAAVDALENLQRLIPRNTAEYAACISTARRLLGTAH